MKGKFLKSCVFVFLFNFSILKMLFWINLFFNILAIKVKCYAFNFVIVPISLLFKKEFAELFKMIEDLDEKIDDRNNSNYKKL